MLLYLVIGKVGQTVRTCQQCRHHSSVPVSSQCHFSTFERAWEPSEEKWHYFKECFKTNVKLSRGTLCSVSQAENTSPSKRSVPSRKNTHVKDPFSGSERRHVLNTGFSSEGRHCVLSCSITNMEASRSFLTFKKNFYSFLWSLKPAWWLREQRRVVFLSMNTFKLKHRPKPFSPLEANLQALLTSLKWSRQRSVI